MHHPLPAREIKSLPEIEVYGYESDPLARRTRKIGYRWVLLAVSYIAFIVAPMFTWALGTNPFPVLVNSALMLVVILPLIVKIADLSTYGLPERTWIYEPYHFGWKSGEFKRANRAGMPLMVMRAVSKDELIECRNCRDEVPDSIEVVETTDFVVFGIPIKNRELNTTNYCGECASLPIGQVHMPYVYEKPG